MGGGPVPYLLGAEIPNAAVREKTQAIGTSWNVIWAFVTNFAIPYMINGIHFKVGWVFGSLSLLALLFTFFFLPETKVINSYFSGASIGLIWMLLFRAAHSRKLTLSFLFPSIHSDPLTFMFRRGQDDLVQLMASLLMSRIRLARILGGIAKPTIYNC
jgi:hypothetical protein